MKRSPLKRGKPIRKRRKKERKSQHASLREEYRAENHQCEFLGVFTPPGGHLRQAVEVHHIARMRVDEVTFLLSLCPACHRWIHDGNDCESVAWCLLIKHRKKELDLPRMNVVKRGKRLEYYLQSNLWERLETLEAIAELKNGGISA